MDILKLLKQLLGPETTTSSKVYWGPGKTPPGFTRVSPAPPQPTMISPLGSTPTPNQPKPSPTPTPMPPGYFNYEPYRTKPGFNPKQPPPEVASLVWENFPKEATKAALVASTENPSYNPKAYNYNTNTTGDYGLMQVNSGTLSGLMQRYPKTMKSIGVQSVYDLQDPVKNMKVARIIRQEQGWKAWYGPGNRGFDIVNK